MTSNSEEINPVALSIAELHLDGGISSVSQHRIFLKSIETFLEGFGRHFWAWLCCCEGKLRLVLG